jgi:hypothetical protein
MDQAVNSQYLVPEITDPGPVAPYVPVAPTSEMGKRVGSASSVTVAGQQ